jgi:uncharacterized alpha/beta hydrolase family protein
LENIKTSQNKDPDIKYAARKLLNLLAQHLDAYEVHIFNTNMLKLIENKGLSISDDTKILATAIDYDIDRHPDETVFVTNDLALKHMANLFFGTDSIESVNEDVNDDYDGYLEVHMTDDEMTEFYSN